MYALLLRFSLVCEFYKSVHLLFKHQRLGVDKSLFIILLFKIRFNNITNHLWNKSGVISFKIYMVFSERKILNFLKYNNP